MQTCTNTHTHAHNIATDRHFDTETSSLITQPTNQPANYMYTTLSVCSTCNHKNQHTRTQSHTPDLPKHTPWSQLRQHLITLRTSDHLDLTLVYDVHLFTNLSLHIYIYVDHGETYSNENIIMHILCNMDTCMH